MIDCSRIGIAEIKIKEGKDVAHRASMPNQCPYTRTCLCPVACTQPRAAGAAPAAAAPGPSAGVGEHIVTAPMWALITPLSPRAKNFVEIGDEVEIGQVMCIIEP